MTKRLTLNKVEKILKNCGKLPHYLASKPISKWDKYDKSNFKSIQKGCKK